MFWVRKILLSQRREGKRRKWRGNKFWSVLKAVLGFNAIILLRNLSKFLFGAISADDVVDVGKDEEASEESDSDDAEGTSSDESVEDLDDVDIDNEVGDEDKEDVEIEEFEAQVDSEGGSEINEDKEDFDGTDNTDSESDTENDAEKLPEDIYGNNLYLRNVKKS